MNFAPCSLLSNQERRTLGVDASGTYRYDPAASSFEGP
ncbi:hypothetical protein ACPOL_0928 [Acidisarcina polymorpha]|uniref:Uncharacterized protein n=1 Tax=Acidisarcina polymorpha TaxID=2211140 RepID=A0A2Z5FTY2_9BACT|nr:hypothetical protein ACPOL_0928 [Acidisarcina polymorpha]